MIRQQHLHFFVCFESWEWEKGRFGLEQRQELGFRLPTSKRGDTLWWSRVSCLFQGFHLSPHAAFLGLRHRFFLGTFGARLFRRKPSCLCEGLPCHVLSLSLSLSLKLP